MIHQQDWRHQTSDYRHNLRDQIYGIVSRTKKQHILHVIGLTGERFPILAFWQENQILGNQEIRQT